MLDLTILNLFVTLWGLYYGYLSAVYVARRVRESLSKRADTVAAARGAPVVLVVPAHNEEDVIEATLRSLLAVDYERLFVMVMNDGSSDSTAQIAGRFVGSGRVMLVNRGPDVAGRGKGAVLNDAFRRIRAMVAASDGPLAGVDPASVIVGVMDADGQLERHALRKVVPLFADPRVGAVQIGVRIANAGDNVLTRFQDMEFVGFSAFVQEARDVIGSVGLGGNGQFTRLSALVSLEREPWTDCLTEDLDLGSPSWSGAGAYGSPQKRSSHSRAWCPWSLCFGSGRDGSKGTTSAGVTSHDCSRGAAHRFVPGSTWSST